MKHVDMKTEKLWLIENLLRIQDEKLIHQIRFFVEELQKKQKEYLKPMTKKEFFAKIEESERAIENGEVISHEDLRKEIHSW